jgi:GAF domain-containing protein
MALNTSQNLEELLNKILEQIRRAIPFQWANIALLEEDSLQLVHFHGNEFRPEVKDSLEKPYQGENFSLFQKIYSTKQPVLIEDTQHTLDCQVFPDAEFACSYVAAPLMIGERMIGVINLASHLPGAFDQETIGQLVAFTAPAAVAVQNARLYTAESLSRQLAENLSAASLALTQTLDFQTVINTLLDFVCHLIPYESVYIAISENEARLIVRASRGCEPQNESTQVVNASIDAWEIPNLNQVYTTRKSLLIPDTHQYRGWKAAFEDKNVRSWLGIPMVAAGEVIGILVLAQNKVD